MLLLTQYLNRKGGIRIKTASGDIWIGFQSSSTPQNFRVAIEAPRSCEILRTELLQDSVVKEGCSSSMAGVLLEHPKNYVKSKKS